MEENEETRTDARRRRALSVLAGISPIAIVATACSPKRSPEPSPAPMSAMPLAQSLNALKALPPTDTAMVAVLYRASANDGGGGWFYWDSHSTLAPDEACIVASEHSSLGRWVRYMGEDASYRNVKWYGAIGDGVADDTVAIERAIDSVANGGGTVFLPAGTYLVSRSLKLAHSHTVLSGTGATRTSIVMSDSSTDEYVIWGDRINGVEVRDIAVDVNQAGRAGALGLKRRACGIVLYSCKDSVIHGCIVKNTIGDDKHNSGVAIGVAVGPYGDESARCKIFDCIVQDCGPSPARKSDGIFVSGDQILVSNCIARNVTDTGFVIESSTASGITGCSAWSCSAGAAISHADVRRDSNGNYINGLSIYDYDAAVTGAISINVPVATQSRKKSTCLRNTIVSNVTVECISGKGPAINVRRVSETSKVVGLSLSSIRIRRSGSQGILVDGDDVMISDCDIEDCADAAIQIQHASRVVVQGCRVTSPQGALAIAVQDSKKVLIRDSVIDCKAGQTVWGVYGYGATTEMTVMNNLFDGWAKGDVGSDPGAKVTVLRPTLTSL
ncbi:hypothetical protein R20233_01438 [Ralstonia sp. LMG 32965]|uniref:glycosyl hydrolase family 28-related protein n=1 Tax=Ralstonia flatus TaxID=3058601 RepID=UPI0028F591AF|nr:glycosyl hydrolase family 28-related protein [Ralstonia sp. LMG 32965]CAJ0867719.1 hypothetical protein R20233_01438 [Ralstonia sp. LMG 32965]